MRLLRLFAGSALIHLTMTGVAFAQAGTFNGRVLDQGDAVLPGVTANAEGLYFMPGLDPGIYDVKTELAGFSPAARERVTLAVNATITLDFRLRVAALNETIRQPTGFIPGIGYPRQLQLGARFLF